MHFATRNAFYLRISANTVLPLYLYLDERHVGWMSEHVLQHVLSDLRPLIIPKLNAEADTQLGPGGSANAKRGTLETHRGETYQFGYFLRGTEPHAVLIKSRAFTFRPVAPRQTSPLPPPPSESEQPGAPNKPSGRSKRAKPDVPKTSKKRKPKPRPKGKGKARAVDEEEETISISSNDDMAVDGSPTNPIATRRSKRAKKVITGSYREDPDDDMPDADTPHDPEQDHREVVEAPDDPMHTPVHDIPLVPKHEETETALSELPPPSADGPSDIEHTDATMEVELVDEEEESKPKPVLRLQYHGFNIHGRCLCVIVEPYPPLRAATRAPSLVSTDLIAPRAPSIAPPEFVPSGAAAQRERTPLFLPEYDREPTPAPSGTRNLPPVPLFSEAAEASDDEDGEMVLFSQILRSMGDHPPGLAEDDEEIDGAVFFGDADEMREL